MSTARVLQSGAMISIYSRGRNRRTARRFSCLEVFRNKLEVFEKNVDRTGLLIECVELLIILRNLDI